VRSREKFRRRAESAGDMLSGILNRATAGMSKEEAAVVANLVTLDGCWESFATSSNELLKRRADEGDRLCQYVLLSRLDPAELQRLAEGGDKLARGALLNKEGLGHLLRELLQAGNVTLQ
jgi:hypothetical protein